jgi:exodeoxyribonuclease III
MSQERLDFKLGFYDAFLDHAQDLRRDKPIVVCGDFNTAHREIDLKNPKANENTSGFLPIERAWMDRFMAHGYVDTFRHCHGDVTDAYSWWTYRFGARSRNVGWRIDYFFVSEELQGAVRDAWIEAEVPGSDHCPVGLSSSCPNLTETDALC